MIKEPKTFLVGITQPDLQGLEDYLKYTNQLEFLDQFRAAYDEFGPTALVSFYAKLCYKSLVLGKNKNVSKIRDIEDNIKSVIDTGHGSVGEHVWLNWITTDCSRILTHELVRHRAGTAFSQTSGRYCSIENIDLVLPPELRSPSIEDKISNLNKQIENTCRELRDELINDKTDFTEKKKITSAIRRIAPNGQTNEIGWSCNIRSLRHMIEMRTNRAAEWEIRVVFNQVADIVNQRWPLMLYGGKKELVDGLYEYTNLKV